MWKRLFVTMMCCICVFVMGCSGTDECNEAKETIDSTDIIESEPIMIYTPAAKPVIYLYPTETTKLDVTLDFDGQFTATYPKYENKWTVTAEPDGTLTDEAGRQYNYLFWEGLTDTEFGFDTGFCIAGENTAAFLEDALTKLGLTDKEQCDFITYWLPQMECNKYNVISFQGDAYTNIAKLETSVPVDTEIRVFMTWYPSDVYVNIPEQELSVTKRNGFILVEWGGSKIEKE